MSTAGSIIAGSAFVKMTLDNAELNKGLQAAQGKLKRFAAAVNDFGNQMTMIGAVGGFAVFNAAKTFADFDDQMRLTSAVSGATGEQFKILTELAKKLGRETSFTAAQVAGGMTALGRMGFNPEEIQKAIHPMMNLSRTTGTDLALSAEIAGNTLRALGMEVSKTELAVDVLMTTANGSAQTLMDLGEALKYAAPAARTVGEDIYDVNAALGVLANVGIKGSLAGTALKRAYSELAKTDIQEYLKKFNVQVVDGSNNMRKYADILRDCVKAMATMGNAEKMSFATKVFGERAAPGALAITADTSKIDEFITKLRNSQGAAEKQAKMMDSGAGGQLRQLASAAEGVVIAFGEIAAVSFTPVVQSLMKILLAMRDLLSENDSVIKGFLRLTGTVVGIGVAIKGLAIAAGAFKALLTPVMALDKMFLALRSSTVTLSAAQGRLAASHLWGMACSKKHAAAIAAASMTEMVAARKAAAAGTVRIGVYYAEAAAAKVAAAATWALNAAMKFASTHPVMLAFMTIATAVWAISEAAQSAENALQKQIDAAKKAIDISKKNTSGNDQSRKNAQNGILRLKQLEELSRKGKLTAEEIAEAERIIKNLDPFGSKNWASVDTVTGKVTVLADAQDRLNATMRDTAIKDLTAEIDAYRAAIEKLAEQNKKLKDSFFGPDDDELKQIEENTENIKEYEKQIRSLKDRRSEVKYGLNSNAVTGESDDLQSRVQRSEQQRITAAEKIAEAEKAMLKIEEDLAKSKMDALQKEIAAIQKMKKEYADLYELKRWELHDQQKEAELQMEQNAKQQTDAEKKSYSDAERKYDAITKQIKELDDRAVLTDAGFAEQIQNAKLRDQQKIDEEYRKKFAEIAEYEKFLPDADKEQKIQKEQKQEDALFADLLKKAGQEDPAAYHSGTDPRSASVQLRTFMEKFEKAVTDARKHYQTQLENFQSVESEDGIGLSPAEKNVLDGIQNSISGAMSRLQGYKDRIQGGIDAARTVQTSGAWSISELARTIFSAKDDNQKKIAESTAKTEEHAKRIFDKISTMKFGISIQE